MLKQCRFILLSVLATLIIIFPTQAAERIYFNYSALGFTVTIAELQTFAQEGKLSGDLEQLLGRFSPERRHQIQQALQVRYPVNSIMVDRFSYTSSGDRLLYELGELIQTGAHQNGAKGIRSAAILATGDPAGVSVIRFLQKFPTDMRIDLQRVLKLVRRVSGILETTRQTVVALNQREQAASAMNLAQLPDLRQPGNYTYQKQSFSLRDLERNRILPVDLYLPKTENAANPVIIMSNGLGAERDRFDQIAPHLASHGFIIVTLDHPGSDRKRLREFYAGLHHENFDATEYFDRPKDITFLLNQLEQLNQTQFNQQLDFNHIGIFGYSFGGSTALALAGAEIDFDYLETDCKTQSSLVNISLIYQCRALELPHQTLSLKDERIKAAFLFVPFGKSLFGKAGMAKANIPIVWQATDSDILTPFAVEQLPAFAALTSPNKYFAVTQGLPHARVTYDALSKLTNSKNSWEELQHIAQGYQNALSLAFFKLYVSQDEAYRPYLSAAYARALTQPPYGLSLVQSLE
jgi:predicted dienelactone hydrolase